MPIGYKSAFVLDGVSLNGEDTIVEFKPQGHNSDWLKVEMSLPYAAPNTPMVIYATRVPAGFFKCPTIT